ncbi:hypothetical protein SKAU_G00162200 [Synaphobranchus kaupii]|uniref:Uncharacterized protein n=1 Tax=Synaphobranchus kaupii TaxID=118154 RepID=A0A9Q1FIR1_SYNKA|nr:hypothetical protein SKAU_G00162200 [Synaphobranchus kaupii]
MEGRGGASSGPSQAGLPLPARPRVPVWLGRSTVGGGCWATSDLRAVFLQNCPFQIAALPGGAAAIDYTLTPEQHLTL